MGFERRFLEFAGDVSAVPPLFSKTFLFERDMERLLRADSGHFTTAQQRRSVGPIPAVRETRVAGPAIELRRNHLYARFGNVRLSGVVGDEKVRVSAS
jgi:hypothetical protein